MKGKEKKAKEYKKEKRAIKQKEHIKENDTRVNEKNMICGRKRN